VTDSILPVALPTGIFQLTYVGILTERVHRTLVVLIGVITTRAWIRRGLPTALAACAVASVLDIVAVSLGLF